MTTCGRRLPDYFALMRNGFVSKHWPWHAAIYRRFDRSAAPTYQCGGTVISLNSVLTAGHCVSVNNAPNEPADIFVSLGRLNLSASESTAQSFEVIFVFSF